MLSTSLARRLRCYDFAKTDVYCSFGKLDHRVNQVLSEATAAPILQYGSVRIHLHVGRSRRLGKHEFFGSVYSSIPILSFPTALIIVNHTPLSGPMICFLISFAWALDFVGCVAIGQSRVYTYASNAKYWLV